MCPYVWHFLAKSGKYYLLESVHPFVHMNWEQSGEGMRMVWCLLGLLVLVSGLDMHFAHMGTQISFCFVFLGLKLLTIHLGGSLILELWGSLVTFQPHSFSALR